MAARDFDQGKGAGTVTIRSISAIPDVLRELGANVEKVLGRAGLEPDLFSNRDNLLTYSALGRLVGECVKITGCEDFGLRVGMRQSAGNIGLAGFVAINSLTVQEALQTIVSSLKLSDTGATVSLDSRDEAAVLSYVIISPNVEAADHLADGAIAIACNLMRQLRGSAWRPLEVCLTRSRPLDIGSFAKFFGAPIRFDGDEACLIFSRGELDSIVANRDTDLHEILAPLLEKAVTDFAGGFEVDVRKILRAQISNAPLTPVRAAKALGMNSRTLARRLAKEKLTFSEIAQDVKYQTAQMLLQRDKDVAEIAMMIGYSDVTAFIRAFRSWSGMTPARWRVEQQNGRPPDED